MDTDLANRVLGFLIDVSGAKEPLTPEWVQTTLEQGLTEDAFKELDTETGQLVSTPRSTLAKIAIDFFRQQGHPVTDRLMERRLTQRPTDERLTPAKKASYLSILADVHHRRNGGGDYFRLANVVHLTRELVAKHREQSTLGLLRQFILEQDPEKKEHYVRLAADAFAEKVSGSDEDRLSFEEALRLDADEYARRKAEGDPTENIVTGFHEFDRRTGGLGPQQMLVICARPNNMKSLQTKWILLNNFKQGKTVALANVEDPYDMQRHRVAGLMLKINDKRIREATLTQMEEARLAELPALLERRENKYIILPPNRVRCVADIEALLYERLQAGKIDLVGMDYIQVFQPNSGVYRERRERYGAVLDDMAEFMKRWQIPLVVTAQFNREAELVEKPTMRCISECGDIEQRAFHIWGIMKDRVSDRLWSNWVMKSKNAEKHYEVPYEFDLGSFMIRPTGFAV